MASFDKYAPLLMKWEAGVPSNYKDFPLETLFAYAKVRGYVNDPDDRGGATQVGVTLSTYRMVFGESKSAQDLKFMPYREWRYIMKSFYWDKVKADQIENQSIADMFADWVVNSGTSAIRKVQTIFGLKSDGIVGPRTLEALNGGDPKVVFDRIKNARLSFYRKIVLNNASQKKFLKGWENRTNSFIFSV